MKTRKGEGCSMIDQKNMIRASRNPSSNASRIYQEVETDFLNVTLTHEDTEYYYDRLVYENTPSHE